MSDKWRLLLADRQILWGKNDFPSRLMSLFQETDKYQHDGWAREVDAVNEAARQGQPREFEAFTDELETSERFGYSTTAGVVLSRLKLMGFTPETSRRSMAEIRRSLQKQNGEPDDVLYVTPAIGV
ncbi:HEPN/Toprim-associated domain-containing protein [Amycolatopsis keratiniphila]|uniref:HEPN/Toprim-associated domain-containing protein n=1 Tax=Amycolatopsis keratiniphila TaxID=129921 RepID=UPI0033C1F81F